VLFGLAFGRIDNRIEKAYQLDRRHAMKKTQGTRDVLFEPIRIGTLEVKNRIYLPAMHLNMAVNYEVTEQLTEFYAERARGGAGLICVGYATVDELSGMMTCIGAHGDEYIPGLRRLAAAIKENGAKSAVQLNHSGRYNFSFFLGGKQAVAPSAVPSRLTKETPRELALDEIPVVIDAFVKAALRCREAGFEAVEVLHGTGYLISSFLSPYTNHRTDGYGGSFENRMRFGLEVMRAMRAAVGRDYPLTVRMNGNDFMPGGIGRRDLQTYARHLVAEGVDALCINVGWHEAQVPQIVTEVPRGVFAYLARGIRDLVSVPVIASHRINDPRTARELIGDGWCDMVAMGRSLIADPFLPEKARTGREHEIVHCVGCAQGCFDNVFKLRAVECLCNPRAGYERERTLEKAASPKKVMVVGGGPAGMTAAAAAAERGHRVTLYEKADRLGGQLLLAAAPPGRGEFGELAADLGRRLAALKAAVVLGAEVDGNLLDREKPEAVILATGAKPIMPPIPGADLGHVVQAWDVLQGEPAPGRSVVVIGGGAVGVETAMLLAEKGTLSAEALRFLLLSRAEDPDTLYELAARGTKEVVLVEMQDKLGKDIGKTTRWGMLQNLDRSRVVQKLATKVVEITARGVKVKVGDREETLAADTVVLAVGAVPHNPLKAECEKRGIFFKVVGDAAKVAMAFDAIHAGFLAAREI
jgi:2,4-dienoyl-CoA reductase (NADPH2)